VIAPAAVLAAAVAVGPSFASSFLTEKQASKTFLNRNEATIFRGAASSVPVGPIFSTTSFGIPDARVTFKTDSTADLLATFSAQTQCTADTNGLGCPIQFIIDGSAGPKINLGTASSATPAAAADTHTASQIGVVTAGKHSVEIRYAGVTGAANASIGFKVSSWNLAVQAYPDPVAEDTDTDG
jgi:hypothetical protein